MTDSESSLLRDALREKGESVLEAALSRSSTAPRAPRASRAARRAALDPDVMAMGTFLEHARVGALLAVAGGCTASQLVLLRLAVLAFRSAPLSLLLMHCAPCAALAHAAQTHGLVSDGGISLRRAQIALPDALFHTLLSLATFRVLTSGSVEVFVAVTAAVLPPLCALFDSHLARTSYAFSAKQRSHALSGTAAAALTALLERRAYFSLVLALFVWLCVFTLDRAFDILRRAPRLPVDAEGGGGVGSGDALSGATRFVHGCTDLLSSSTEVSAPPPTPFERLLLANLLPCPILAVLALLSGEMGAIELSVPTLTAVALSSCTSALASISLLLIQDTQLVSGAAMARATAGCNVAALALNAVVGVLPRPSILARLTALAAVVAGAAFKLA